MILSKDISVLIDPLFPNLINYLPTDREYEETSEEEVISLINKFKDPLNLYIPYVWECEEIASAFIVDIRREERDLGAKRNKAIGEALGTKWNGVQKSHHANIFFTKTKVFMFDLQTSKIWEAELGKDDIFFIRI